MTRVRAPPLRRRRGTLARAPAVHADVLAPSALPDAYIADFDRRRAVSPQVYFKGAVGAIVVHDINKKGENCFDAPKRWKKELDEHVGVAGKAADGKGVPTVLLANKCDLLGDRAVPKEALDKVAAESGFFRWFETSAKTGVHSTRRALMASIAPLAQPLNHFDFRAGHNVEAAITALVEQVMHNQGVTAGGGEKYSVVKLGEGGGAASGGGGCCG